MDPFASETSRQDAPGPSLAGTNLPDYRPRLPQRILILNWRDPSHPKAGGAETLTMKWAQAWRDAGAKVTLFANAFRGCTPDAFENGIRIVRRGSPLTQWFRARAFDRQSGSFDLVVEEINTLPFFSALWAHGRSVLVMHQLARRVWFYETPWPIALMGYWAEPIYLRAYSHQPALVLSESTRHDLVKLGFRSDWIHVVPGAAAAVDQVVPPREEDPIFLYVGRLTASKRVDHIVRAFGIAHHELARRGLHIRLRIVGRGKREYVAKLKRLVEKAYLQNSVEFWGWMDRDWWSYDELRASHVLLLASVREGWGLVVTEANAVGIPAIGYAVPGLRDSIQDGRTGILTNKETPTALAKEMIRIATSRQLWDRLSSAARQDAVTRDWTNSQRQAVGGLVAAVRQLDSKTSLQPGKPSNI